MGNTKTPEERLAQMEKTKIDIIKNVADIDNPDDFVYLAKIAGYSECLRDKNKKEKGEE